VIATEDDEVVTPYANAFLPEAPNVTNITVQQQCPQDSTDHLELAYDPVALADVLNALDPANPVRVPCVPVLPLTGPVSRMRTAEEENSRYAASPASSVTRTRSATSWRSRGSQPETGTSASSCSCSQR
jgi:hypothetical protein